MKDTPSNSGYTAHAEVDKPELQFGLEPQHAAHGYTRW